MAHACAARRGGGADVARATREGGRRRQGTDEPRRDRPCGPPPRAARRASRRWARRAADADEHRTAHLRRADPRGGAARCGVPWLPVEGGASDVRSRARQARRPGARLHPAREGEMKTRITELLDVQYPIFQAAMSWAAPSSALVIAVSNAGGMGVLAAGPLRIGDYRRILGEIKAGTKKPYGVNIPLNNPKAPEMLDIAYEARIPVMVASQGGPQHFPRFKAIGTKWLHVVASVEHARKAEAAGVDALIVDGTEAGGHPPPAEVTTLVLVRRVLQEVKLPVVASGGVADGAGIAALLALGADAVQLGPRFLAPPEASAPENNN